ncbi:serine protein kinase RIO [Methanosphaera sp. WGK6]|uniref:serine protein kinase RIO n=1 Tax=Methanosphaera sp. WGK6 TaxID=1561964 RepID=UPI00084C8645|nr:serine protein kinase RIO [Methanosphaera sp. WGK6]OED30606.1 serine/threonine protein kinase [Methanosphaera sp. WGK6]
MKKHYIDADNQIRKLEETKKIKSVEDKQVSSEVFDDKTLKVLYKLAKQGYINSLNGVISTGKEANVFLGTDDDGNSVAVKIYRVVTLDFKKIKEYIAGDPRFKTYGNNTRKIITAWTQKEFKNLSRLHKLGLRVPEPYTALENVLVMEYLEHDENDASAAPPLSKIKLDNAEKIFEEIINFMDISYNQAKLVHGDLSRYNILLSYNHPYIIDLSQATLTSHPSSMSLLERDIKNIVYDSKKFNVNLSYEYIKNRIIKEN